MVMMSYWGTSRKDINSWHPDTSGSLGGGREGEGRGGEGRGGERRGETGHSPVESGEYVTFSAQRYTRNPLLQIE